MNLEKGNNMRFFTRSDLAGSKSYVYAIIPIYKNDGLIVYIPPANFYDNLKETIRDYQENPLKNKYYIGVFEKRLLIDSLDTDAAFNDILLNFENKGVDFDYIDSFFQKSDHEDFKKVLTAWIKKRVKKAWYAGELLGKLVL